MQPSMNGLAMNVNTSWLRVIRKLCIIKQNKNMKKMIFKNTFGLLCAMLVCPCIGTRAQAGSRIDSLVCMSRHGNVEATRELAECYAQGNGVDKNWVNSVMLYGMYQQASGASYESLMTSVGKDHPLRLAEGLLNIFLAAEKKEVNMDSIKSEYIELGREHLDFVERFMLRENQSVEGEYEQNLISVCDRYPFVNCMLGISYMEQMAGEKDIQGMLKSVKYLREADKHAMLSRRGAAILLDFYECFGGKELEPLDDKERERLIKLRDMGFPTQSR